MISVPDAATFPKTPRPVRLENSSITAAGKPLGNVGMGWSVTMPAISAA